MCTKRGPFLIGSCLVVVLGAWCLLAVGAMAGDAGPGSAEAAARICPPTLTPYVTMTPPPPPRIAPAQAEKARPRCAFMPSLFDSKPTVTPDNAPTMTPPPSP